MIADLVYPGAAPSQPTASLSEIKVKHEAFTRFQFSENSDSKLPSQEPPVPSPLSLQVSGLTRTRGSGSSLLFRTSGP